MKIPCPYCGQTFPSVDTLEAHIRSAHPIFPETKEEVTGVVPWTYEELQKWGTDVFDVDEFITNVIDQTEAGEGAVGEGEAGVTPEGGGLGDIKVARWETVSRGGWDYLVGYNAAGEIVVGPDPLGRQETAEMSEAERESLALQKENLTADIKLAWQQLEQQWDIAQMQYGAPQWRPGELALTQQQLAAQRQQALWGQQFQEQQFGLTQEQFAAQQAQQAQQWGLTQEQWQAQQAQQAQQWGLTQEQFAAQQQQALWAQSFQEQQLTQQQLEAQRQYELSMLPYGQMTAYQQAQTAQQERAYGAQLAAQPMSWLQYAAYTGEQPAVQPWMLPLMPQEYQQLGAGQAIPGYTAESMAGMPQLTTPSRQYQARMSPEQREMYYGYRQARTGERPEETQWRLWSSAPPSGRYAGLSRAR